jgi:hypothetical protein
MVGLAELQDSLDRREQSVQVSMSSRVFRVQNVSLFLLIPALLMASNNVLAIIDEPHPIQQACRSKCQLEPHL